MITSIFEWIVFGVLCFVAIGWVFGCWTYYNQGKGISLATVNSTIIFFVLIGWSFHYSGMNKLHLLWLTPLVVILSNLITNFVLFQVFQLSSKQKAFFLSLLILLCINCFLLWLITPRSFN